MKNMKNKLSNTYKRIISFITAMTLVVAVFCCPLGASAISHGVDLSNNNGLIDFNALSKQVSFCYLKASESTNYIDSQFERNSQAISNTTMKWGAYEFFHGKSVKSAKQEAVLFWKVIQHTHFSMLPCVDVELFETNTAKELRTNLKAFIAEFKRISGYDVVIYTYQAFTWQYLNGEFSKYLLWQSQVGVKQYGNTLGWKSPAIWQYDWKGRFFAVSNGSTDVDLDILYNKNIFLTKAQLKKQSKVVVKSLWDKSTYLVPKSKISIPYNANVRTKLYTYNINGIVSKHFVNNGQSIKIVDITSNHKMFIIYYYYDGCTSKLIHSYLPVNYLYSKINLWNHNTWFTYKTVNVFSLNGKKKIGIIGKNTMADVLYTYKCGDKVIGRFNKKHIYSLFRIKK